MRLPLLIFGAALMLAPSAGLAQQPVPKAEPPPTAQAPAQAFDPKVARRITADEVKKRLDAGEKVVIIDTRSKFSGPMAKGAAHVPSDKLDAWAKEHPKDALIVAYCT